MSNIEEKLLSSVADRVMEDIDVAHQEACWELFNEGSFASKYELMIRKALQMQLPKDKIIDVLLKTMQADQERFGSISSPMLDRLEKKTEKRLWFSKKMLEESHKEMMKCLC